MTQGANGHSSGMRRIADGETGDAAVGRDRPALSPDDALPPVEPPSASFIIKLFVVPAVIVAVVVGVVMCFQRIAQSDASAESYLAAIERGANNAWQCANDLAHLLQQDPSLRSDETTATRLSNIVTARIRSGPPQADTVEKVKQEVGLRVFLCKALGEFATPAAMPGLLEAARKNAPSASPPSADEKVAKAISDGQSQVRKAALEGLALLIHHMRAAGEAVDVQEPLKLALEASRETGPNHQRAIRERAAYALGVIGGETAAARLVEMLGDLHSNVRFNAATGLARQGNAKGLPVLREMIDPDESVAMNVGLEEQGTEAEKLSEAAKASLKAEMEATIRFSGLSAVEQLAGQKNTASAPDWTGIIAVIEKLRDDPNTHPRVKSKAVEVLNQLEH